MITDLQYHDAIKTINEYVCQLERKEIDAHFISEGIQEVVSLNELFRSNAVTAINNCCKDTFGDSWKKTALSVVSKADLRKIDLKKLTGYRGFGASAKIIFVNLLDENKGIAI